MICKSSLSNKKQADKNKKDENKVQIAFEPKAECTEWVISDIWKGRIINTIENEHHYRRDKDNWRGKQDLQISKNR